MSPLLRRLRDILVLAAVYVVTAYAGFRAAQVHPVVAAIWPAAGLAVGALAWLGPSRWPAIALGAFAANALAGIPLAGAAGIGIGNTLEALLALWLLRRAGFKPALDRVRDLVAFIGLAAGAAPLAGAAIGIASLHLSGAAGPGGSLGVLWLTWWSGDAIGILVVAPLFLVWLAAREASRPTPGGFRTGAMVILLLAAFSIYLFGREAESGYLVLGAATWTAYLLGLHGATVSTLVVAAIASIFTILKLPGGPSPEDTLVALKLFLAVLSVSGLGVAVLAAGRASAAAKFEGIVNNADEAIVAVTADQRIMLFNHGAERIFGIAAMDAMGRPLDILLPDRFVPGHRRQVEEFLASGGASRRMGARARVFGRRKNGEEFPAMASIFKVPADGGSCLTVILRDVSAEESLRAQLLQSQKMDAVGRLAGGIAHDFNNLLTVILGTGSLLKERFARDPEVQADLGDITGAATRAAELTGQLLAFSRRQVLAPRRLDVNELVRDTCRMLGRVVGEHITLRLDLAPDVGVVEADPGQLEQALLNLAINARDAMPEGGTLTIETANAGLDDAWERDLPPSPGGRYTMIAVSDTGEGLTPEAREHLFEPFFTTKPAGQGTGLGLAMVYGIVKQSGGTIFPYSAPGHGTTFKIYLPQVAGPAEAVFPEAAAEPATCGTETVLVVEDAEPVRLLVARVLGEAGYTVLSAPNGEEALALARRHPGPLHLLVTDIVMPGMSGTALAGALTAERAGMAVLYLSGYTGDAILGSGLLSEGVHFLSKPFSPADLARKVRGVLDGKPSGRLARESVSP